MATVANPFETDEEQSTAGQGQTSAPTTSNEGGMAGTSGGGASPNAAMAGGNNSPSSSGSFQNLSKYINANKGFNAEGGGLAGTVSSNINNQAKQTQQNVQGAQNLFNTQADQNVSGFNNTEAVNEAVQDPYAFTQNNPEGTQKVIAAENAQYTGPKGFQDLQGQESLANLSIQNANVKNLADQTKSQGGQYNLLRQMFGTPSYTGGQQNLDQLIMNNAPGAQSQFAGARQQANNTNQTLGVSQQQAQQQAQQNTQLANQVQAQTRGLLNNAVTGANASINDRLGQAQTAQQTYTEKLQTALKSGQLTADQYEALGGEKSGLTSGMSLYNIDPTQYITEGVGPTAQSVASTGDYNKIAALNQLMGGGAVANEDASKVLQQFSDASKAGTFNPNSQFNSAGYLNSVKGAQQTSDAAIRKRTDEYNSIINNMTDQLNAERGKFNFFGAGNDVQKGLLEAIANTKKNRDAELKQIGQAAQGTHLQVGGRLLPMPGLETIMRGNS